MWRTIDEDEIPLSDIVGADGTGTLKLAGPGRGRKRRIGRITIYSDSTLVPTVDMFKGSAHPENIIDHAEEGRRDISINNPPILQKGTEPIILKWSGATAGARIIARVQFELVAFQQG